MGVMGLARPALVRRWRWGAVLVAVAVLGSLPAVVRSWPVAAEQLPPAELARRIRASSGQPYSGNVATKGRLGLPDIPRLGDQVSLLGESSRLRVWYRGDELWRVDLVSSTGEHDQYLNGTSLISWDSGAHVAERTYEGDTLHLPRPTDLLPPQLGRMLVAAAAEDELSALDPVRVAGRGVPGLRIVPKTETSTVDHVDMWADPATGLPLRISVTARGGKRPVIESQFIDLAMSPPDLSVVTFRPGPGVDVQRRRGGDPLQQALRRSNVPLPDQLAGLRRLTPGGAAVAVYGRGFDVVLAGAVPEEQLNSVLPSSLPTSKRPWGGEVKLMQTPLINLMAGTLQGVGYVLAGPVSLDELDRIVSSVAAGAVS